MINNKITILLILLVALFLRVYGLTAFDLWFDEIGTEMFTSQSLDRMATLADVPTRDLFWQRIKNDPHSSLYYGIIYFGSKILGGGKALRIISVIFGMMTLIVFYRLSRLFFDRPTSIFALSLMSFSPFHLWYAQEARVYAMAGFFSLIAVYVYVKAIKTNHLKYWISFPLMGVLAVLSSYYSVLLFMASFLVLWMKENRIHIKRSLISGGIMAAALLFILPVFGDQLNFVKNEFWLPSPTPLMTMFTWLIFDLGYSAHIIQYSMAFVIFFLLYGYGFYSHFKEQPRYAIILLLLLLAPILFVYVFSKLVMPVYINRQLLIFSPFYYLFIAKGISSIRLKKEKIFVFVCVLALCGTTMVNYYRNYMFDHPSRPLLFTGVVPKKNYHDIVETMNQEVRQGDLIVATDVQSHMIIFAQLINGALVNKNVSFKKYRYLSFPQFFQPFELRFLNISDIYSRFDEQELAQLKVFVPQPSGAMFLDSISFEQQNFKRLWLISSSWFKEGESQGLGINSLQVREKMQQMLTREMIKSQDGVYLELYIR